MTEPRCLILVKSVHHQNTAQVAREMAGVLGAECVAPAECPYSRLAGCDLLGIGSGIYYGRPHDELLQWVRDLPEEHARDIPVFIFTTSGLPFLAKFWHRPLKQALAAKGYEITGEFACRGFDTWGPLWPMSLLGRPFCGKHLLGGGRLPCLGCIRAPCLGSVAGRRAAKQR